MKCRTVLGLFIILIVCSCTQRHSKAEMKIADSTIPKVESKSGLKIEYGPNLGTTHVDALGGRHFYVHSTNIITNDTIIPIDLQFALSKEYEFPAFCNAKTYKAFLNLIQYNSLEWIHNSIIIT